jgi:hypothetical protein
VACWWGRWDWTARGTRLLLRAEIDGRARVGGRRKRGRKPAAAAHSWSPPLAGYPWGDARRPRPLHRSSCGRLRTREPCRCALTPCTASRGLLGAQRARASERKVASLAGASPGRDGHDTVATLDQLNGQATHDIAQTASLRGPSIAASVQRAPRAPWVASWLCSGCHATRGRPAKRGS